MKIRLDFGQNIRYNSTVIQPEPVCRNGRRGGLKIPCANNTCGFDPHHRHNKRKSLMSVSPGMRLFVFRKRKGQRSTWPPFPGTSGHWGRPPSYFCWIYRIKSFTVSLAKRAFSECTSQVRRTRGVPSLCSRGVMQRASAFWYSGGRKQSI